MTQEINNKPKFKFLDSDKYKDISLSNTKILHGIPSNWFGIVWYIFIAVYLFTKSLAISVFVFGSFYLYGIAKTKRYKNWAKNIKQLPIFAVVVATIIICLIGIYFEHYYF